MLQMFISLDKTCLHLFTLEIKTWDSVLGAVYHIQSDDSVLVHPKGPMTWPYPSEAPNGGPRSAAQRSKDKANKGLWHVGGQGGSNCEYIRKEGIWTTPPGTHPPQSYRSFSDVVAWRDKTHQSAAGPIREDFAGEQSAFQGNMKN